MRKPDGGYTHILQHLGRLATGHAVHMQHYGTDNRLRMTGQCETSSYDQFTFGVANRAASVRIPRSVYQNQCGYLEDRRPASNADPYQIFSVHVGISAAVAVESDVD